MSYSRERVGRTKFVNTRPQPVTERFPRGSDCRLCSTVSACSVHSRVQGKGFIVAISALEPQVARNPQMRSNGALLTRTSLQVLACAAEVLDGTAATVAQAHADAHSPQTLL